MNNKLTKEQQIKCIVDLLKKGSYKTKKTIRTLKTLNVSRNV